MSFALETNQLVALVLAVVCLAALAVIVVAPWRNVRAEPRIPDEVETRLLLGEDPAEIAEDEDEEESEGDDGPPEGADGVIELDPERRPSA